MTVLKASPEQVRRDVVYLLTTGQYPDQGIFGVFSSREAAERIAAAIGDDDDPQIDEWIVDEKVGETFGPVYIATVDINGNLERIDKRLQLRSDQYTDSIQLPGDRGYIGFSAVSPEHAFEAACRPRIDSDQG